MYSISWAQSLRLVISLEFLYVPLGVTVSLVCGSWLNFR